MIISAEAMEMIRAELMRIKLENSDYREAIGAIYRAYHGGLIHDSLLGKRIDEAMEMVLER